MSIICAKCGGKVADGVVNCETCGAEVNSQATTLSSSQTMPLPMPNGAIDDMLSRRLEKALKRSEQLSYAAAGLGIAIIILLLIIYILP